MGILVIFASAFAKLTIGSYDTGRQAREQTEATFFAQESLEAVHSVARRDWDSLTGSSLGLQIMTGAYALSDTPDTSGKFTRTIDITDVERDGNDDIVESGGTVDDSTRKIMTTVTWNVGEGRPNAISFVSYITQWFASSISTWFIDLLSDFQQGFLNGTELTETGNGEVQLKDIGYFSNATELTTEDLDGTADVTDIHIDSVTDRLYMTTTEYAGGSNPEFFVYDISNMSDSAMTLSGSLDLDAGSNGFALGTDYAYVLNNDDSAEVQVVRLSDLTIVATWDVPSGADPNDIVIDESADQAYVVTANSTGQGSEEFYILDISNPEAVTIQITGQAELGDDGNAIAVGNGYAYIGMDNQSAELVIVDISSPGTSTSCNLNNTMGVVDVVVEGTRLFTGRMGGGDAEFAEYAIDPTDPDDCSYIINNVTGEANLDSDDVLAITVDTDLGFAFVSAIDPSEELTIVDLSTFTSTRHDLSGTDYCDAIAFLGSYIYAGCRDDTQTLQVIQGAGSAPTLCNNPSGTADGNTPGNDDATAIAVSGNYAYIGTTFDSNDAEFFVFDISSLSTGMVPVASIEVGDTVNDIAISGNYAYLATNDNSKELFIVNITTPTSPSEAGSYNSDESKNGYSVAISGTTAYLGTQNNTGNNDHEFYALDVSDPASISKLGSFEIGVDVDTIAINGSAAFIGTSSNNEEIISLDISDPGDISQSDTFNLSGNSNVNDVIVYQSSLIVARDNGGNENDFHVINITDPANLTETSSVNLGSSSDQNNGIAVDAGDAACTFIAGTQNGGELQNVDMSDLNAPAVAGNFNLEGDAFAVAYDGTNIYAATSDDDKELQILEIGGEDLFLSPHYGSFTSDPFDSGNEPAGWSQISWTESGTGTITMRIKTADIEENLKQATWVGSDGTNTTAYTLRSGEDITTDPDADGTRFIQWKAYFSGSGSVSPVLEDVTLTYE